ncbi:hypothetical protein Dsin_019302 [Dipteronia sinensis]|uniref:Uncharacterized protein n=1 Tax=Dipteronia sinensis TaxID=43782 RepID=A0AAE0E2X5_9ROSI|nr:hypothetical protein Dsin_019302 [Dipteronia sinensis]
MPKKSGGLGIKKLEENLLAAMMRHIWSLFAKAKSLWVAWVKENLLRGKSFWQVSIPQICTWSWRKLLKFRDEANHFVSFDVGNEKNIYLWFDGWYPDGVLYEKYEHPVRVCHPEWSMHVMSLCSVLNPHTCWGDVVSFGLEEWRGKTMKAYLCRSESTHSTHLRTSLHQCVATTTMTTAFPVLMVATTATTTFLASSCACDDDDEIAATEQYPPVLTIVGAQQAFPATMVATDLAIHPATFAGDDGGHCHRRQW